MSKLREAINVMSVKRLTPLGSSWRQNRSMMALSRMMTLTSVLSVDGSEAIDQRWQKINEILNSKKNCQTIIYDHIISILISIEGI